MLPATRFTAPAAVETWDAWFRWRSGGALRDVTIDATWWRVVDAVTLQDDQAPLWKHRYVDAFSRWRLLPDERLLRAAGTGVRFAVDGPPSAVLNVAAFLNDDRRGGARFDEANFINTATLAVRLLDDALLSHPELTNGNGLRIGLIGFADALVGLSLPYGGLLAREFARDVARALAQGCLRGAVDLAEERGAATTSVSEATVARHETRGMPQGLIERMEYHGLRHALLTAIEPHPLLARLANGTTDGFDPALADGPIAPDVKWDLLRSVQPWIDEPIQLQPAGLLEPATATG